MLAAAVTATQLHMTYLLPHSYNLVLLAFLRVLGLCQCLTWFEMLRFCFEIQKSSEIVEVCHDDALEVAVDCA